MPESKRLKHRDRVICPTNRKLQNKVFTIQSIPEYNYLRLYQVSEAVLFTKTGTCIQTSINSLFREGDCLEFYKADSEY